MKEGTDVLNKKKRELQAGGKCRCTPNRGAEREVPKLKQVEKRAIADDALEQITDLSFSANRTQYRKEPMPWAWALVLEIGNQFVDYINE